MEISSVETDYTMRAVEIESKIRNYVSDVISDKEMESKYFYLGLLKTVLSDKEFVINTTMDEILKDEMNSRR